jgi:acyl-CoA reductase-like NAD-dependent aldehyde dehydrogenase
MSHPPVHPDRAQRLAELVADFLPGSRIGSVIAGAVEGGGGGEIVLTDAFTGLPLTAYADGGADAAQAAVQASEAAFPLWQALTASARGRAIWAIGQQVRQHAAALAEIEAISAGKPIRDARAEVGRVAEMFEYYAGWADKIEGSVIPVPTSHLNYVRREAYGVVTQITPWNAPLFTAGWQIAPALAAGNTVVLKPSELTPLTSLALGVLIARTDAPRGLVNVLAGHGHTAGAAAVAHPLTRLVVFVGSVGTGRVIATAAAQGLKPVILELGGKSANIVFDDADIEPALLGAQAAIFSGAGQSCVAGSRLLVHRAIRNQVVARLAQAARRIPIGDPLDEATQIGPISNQRQWSRISGMVAESQLEGATVAAGGARPAGLERGHFYAPTVLDAVTPGMMIAREEVFGPVVSVMTFDDEDEAVTLANSTAFGLAGAVWTRDVGRAHRVAAKVRAGTFWINSYKAISVMSPFGGFHASGHGRSSGLEALHAYTTTKSVWVETAKQPVSAFGYAAER